MKAAQIVEPGRVEVVEAPVPPPADGEALIRSHRASICGSDIHIVYDGFYLGDFPAPPGFPGHEGVGRVEHSRTAALKEGDWVLAVPNPPVARTYADFHVVPGSSLIALPDGGDPDRLLNAQQLGTVVYAFRRHWPATMSAEGKTVAICGAGSAGLFFTQLARRAGFEKVIIADRAALRLDIAKRFGADVTVQVPTESFVDSVLEHTDGVGADLVIEAVGLDQTRIQCLDAVRFQGRVGYFGFPERPTKDATWSYQSAWQKTPTIEIVTGTQREPGLRSFREAIELIHGGEIDVDPFVTPVFPIEKAQEALDAARDRLAGKIAIEFAP
jgi:threonine dehydrogenase-like Zn-dependent dehydrogenase